MEKMTPNIKALAEQVKKNYEAEPAWSDLYRISTISYELASALLRLLEDADRLAFHVAVTADVIALGGTPKRAKATKVLDAHNKLMTELGQSS